MSESASILEGEISREFSPVDKLKVNNQGEGLSFWVPADGIELSSLTASENGLFLAFEDECDAYDEVEVDVPEDVADTEDKSGKITGKDPNDGNDYEVGLGDDGTLTTEMIPAAIHIVVPPRKLKYEAGEALDFSGIHVYLMDGNNHRYTDSSYPTGEIPFGELFFPVTTADEEYITGYKKATYNGLTVNYCGANALNCAYRGMNPQSDITTRGVEIASGGTCYALYHSSYFPGMSIKQYGGYILSQEPFTFYEIHEGERYGSAKSSGSKITTEHGVEYYFASAIGGFTDQYNIESMFPPPTFSESVHFLSDAAEAIWLGTIEEASAEIPVQWMRTDGEILEDTFQIEVGEGGEPSPPQPDPWGGYADVSWGGHHYNLNRRIVPQVHYANGYCWQEGTSEYTVEQAASMGWLILIR